MTHHVHTWESGTSEHTGRALQVKRRWIYVSFLLSAAFPWISQMAEAFPAPEQHYASDQHLHLVSDAAPRFKASGEESLGLFDTLQWGLSLHSSDFPSLSNTRPDARLPRKPSPMNLQTNSPSASRSTNHAGDKPRSASTWQSRRPGRLQTNTLECSTCLSCVLLL